MRDFFSFTDPEILRTIGIIQDEGESIVYSDPIKMDNGDWIEISLTEKMPKPRPPSLEALFGWRLRVWESAGNVIAGAIWDNHPQINPEFCIISQGMWKKCSESEMRDFLMSRSNQLAEWFLWNMV